MSQFPQSLRVPLLTLALSTTEARCEESCASLLEMVLWHLHLNPRIHTLHHVCKPSCLSCDSSSRTDLVECSCTVDSHERLDDASTFTTPPKATALSSSSPFLLRIMDPISLIFFSSGTVMRKRRPKEGRWSVGYRRTTSCSQALPCLFMFSRRPRQLPLVFS